MLVEIRCGKFREGTIPFHEGLNVVLGDSLATNSIGKSTLLMVIDFVFGGDSLLKHNTDIVKELGHHDYFFVFVFNETKYVFRRGTATPDLIYKCDEDSQETNPISIDEFRAFLKTSYALENVDLTFRSSVSLFSRVWGKDNYHVNYPLKSHPDQPSSQSVDNLLKLYRQFETIKALSQKVKSLSDERKLINKASKQQLIPKSTKTQYKKNILKASGIEQEIQDIKANLAKYAVNISELVNRKILDLKKEKDRLLKEQSHTESRLRRVRSDLSENKHVRSKSFSGLLQFFPEANAERLLEVEEFHSKISKILKGELQESERLLADTLSEINDAIHQIDSEIEHALSRIDNPTVIVDRVHELATSYSSVKSEIKSFEKSDQVNDSLKEANKLLEAEKSRILKFVEDIINDKTRKFVDQIYSEQRRSPILSLAQKSYTFSAVEDTGTGKAYSNLIILDLAVLETTILPFAIHDSFLFKNIENEAVAHLIELYVSIQKQSFIAIDEIEKYGKDAEQILLKNKVVKLTTNRVLYTKDWRK
jgi:hypothetical protein